MGEVFGRQMGRGIRTWLAEEDSKQRRRRKERKRRYRGGARRREGGVIAESFWGIFLEFRLLRRGVLFGAGFLGCSAGEDILGGNRGCFLEGLPGDISGERRSRQREVFLLG